MEEGLPKFEELKSRMAEIRRALREFSLRIVGQRVPGLGHALLEAEEK